MLTMHRTKTHRFSSPIYIGVGFTIIETGGLQIICLSAMHGDINLCDRHKLCSNCEVRLTNIKSSQSRKLRNTFLRKKLQFNLLFTFIDFGCFFFFFFEKQKPVIFP